MTRAVAWDESDAAWRDPAQVASNWGSAGHPRATLLRGTVEGDWWGLLDRLEVTLLVSREYEHLLLAMSVRDGRPLITYLPLPHPSGIASSPGLDTVYVASTRNPNQILQLRPTTGGLPRLDLPTAPDAPVLVPTSSRFLPGALYLHDLAFIDGQLHANAVGENAVIRLDDDDAYERVWWPRSIERDGKPDFGRNYLQLNSIAAGSTVAESQFSASTDRISSRRPGHRNFPVDRRGVVFSGATREPVVRGLTRPHSARHHEGRLWIANSGYGEIGTAEAGTFTALARLPGWTRGLAFVERVAFVGISRVIPRFRQYAPGLDTTRSLCGVRAVDTATGSTIAAITWPGGNQIFALETLPRTIAAGLPFETGARKHRPTALFYGFRTEGAPQIGRGKSDSAS